MIGRGSAGVRLFNVADNEHVVSAVRLDEQEEPENEAEEAIVEEMARAAAARRRSPSRPPTAKVLPASRRNALDPHAA